jgi:hypothetical protein
VKFNAPDSIVTPAVAVLTQGTLSAASGWDVQSHLTGPNDLFVAGYGAIPLSNAGALVDLRFRCLSDVAPGESTAVTITDFLFNAGIPPVTTKDGSIRVATKVCGDADENGLIQAYDAALALREAVGPLPAPPPPLSAMGRLNADVDGNGLVEAYDAALIIRAVLGLSMPQGVSNCFGTGNPGVPDTITATLSASATDISRGSGHAAVSLKLGGVRPSAGIIALSFDLSLAADAGATAALVLSRVPGDYLVCVNRLDSTQFRVGIAGPRGISSDSLVFTLSAQAANALGSLHMRNIRLNKTASADLDVAGIVLGVQERSSSRPGGFNLVGCYPNPFNPSTRIVFDVPVQSRIVLDIFSPLGVKVRSLVCGVQAEGRHEVSWDGRSEAALPLASGAYFCRMSTGTYVKTIALLMVK